MQDTPPLGTLTPDDFRRIRQIFEAALERRPNERRVFIEHACGGNTLLAAEVERMLAADPDGDRLLDRGATPDGHFEAAVATRCSSCHATLASDDRFCRRCGTPTHGSSTDEGRFRAGALFANRFRIVARLGRGGMGDVYRADDLELGQPVALKFLTGLALTGPANRLRQGSGGQEAGHYDRGPAKAGTTFQAWYGQSSFVVLVVVTALTGGVLDIDRPTGNWLS